MRIKLHWSLIVTSLLLAVFSVMSQIIPFHNFEHFKNHAPTLEERVTIQELGIKKVLSKKEPLDRELIANVLDSNKNSIVSSYNFIEKLIQSFATFYQILMVLLLAHFIALYNCLEQTKPNKALKSDT